MSANVITDEMAAAVRAQLARRRTSCSRCGFDHALILDPPLCPQCAADAEDRIAGLTGLYRD